MAQTFKTRLDSIETLHKVNLSLIGQYSCHSFSHHWYLNEKVGLKPCSVSVPF